ncbi:transglycosylase SLT domain-containing protein [Halomonas cupida]|uniref:transglycosylase SLT domain-containing protein n=1 Tax=Halomonas cupida TaxID=44933 RepID=UPI003A928770
MARIPVVRERSVRQAGAQAQGLSSNIPQGALGVDLSGAANELADWAQRTQDQANQVATMDADSALQQWENEYLYNPESGALNRRGRDAFGLPEESTQAFDERRQEIRESLANDSQRMAFDRIAASRQTAIQSTVNRYVSQQARDYANEQTNSYIQRSRETAALNWNNPQRVQLEIDRQIAAINAQGDREGVSDDALELARSEARSKTLRLSLERGISRDPDRAMQQYLEFQDQLTVDDRNKLEPEIKKVTAQQIAGSLNSAITGVQTDGNQGLWSRMIQQESGGRQFGDDGSALTSGKGAVGVAQILPSTGPDAAEMAGLPWDPERFRNDPDYNEALGRAYFEKQVEDFGMPMLAAAAYNAGPGQTRKWLREIGDPRTGEITPEEFVNRIPFDETRNYVRKTVGEANYGAASGELGMREALETIRNIEDPDVRKMALTEFSRANSEFNQLRAVEQSELNSRVDDATTAYLQGLDFSHPPVQADFFAAYGAEGGQRYEQFRKIQNVGEALQSLSLASPDERARILSSYQPDEDGVASEGFAEDAELFGAVVNAAQSMQESLQEDPVKYLSQHSQEMRTLLEATATGTPASVEAYASGMIAEQERMGVAQPKLLTSEQQSRIVERFGNVEDGGDNAAQVINSLQNEWGKHWPTVFRQLQNDLPGAALVIGTGVDEATANRLARIAPLSTTDLKQGLDGTDVTDVRDAMNERMADFRVTLVNQAGGERTFTTFYEEGSRLAYSYMAEGTGPQDAVDKAFSALVEDRYTVVDTYRVPKQFDAGEIERGASTALENIDPADLQFDRADWMDEDFANRQIKNILQENAYWVTSPDEGGLVLYSNGEAVLTRDGDPVSRSWDDLTSEAVNNPSAWRRLIEGNRQLQEANRQQMPGAWGATQ